MNTERLRNDALNAIKQVAAKPPTTVERVRAEFNKWWNENDLPADMHDMVLEAWLRGALTISLIETGQLQTMVDTLKPENN
jgi:hypothetical protein